MVHVVPDYRQDWDDAEASRIDLATLGPDDLLCGHFEIDGIYLHQRYPEVFSDPGYRVITFVRDPVEIAQSLYWFERKIGHEAVLAMSLEERVNYEPNYLSDRFPCTLENFQTILDRYWFVGLTERLQVSFDCLAERLGKPRVRVRRRNASPRDAMLTERQVRAFKKALLGASF